MTATTTVDETTWPQRARTLSEELVAAGKLTAPAWIAAARDVPRHALVSEFFERDRSGWRRVSAADPATREQWWHDIYGNTSLVTHPDRRYRIRLGRAAIVVLRGWPAGGVQKGR